jgi:hypothetical protein
MDATIPATHHDEDILQLTDPDFLEFLAFLFFPVSQQQISSLFCTALGWFVASRMIGCSVAVTERHQQLSVTTRSKANDYQISVRMYRVDSCLPCTLQTFRTC